MMVEIIKHESIKNAKQATKITIDSQLLIVLSLIEESALNGRNWVNIEKFNLNRETQKKLGKLGFNVDWLPSRTYVDSYGNKRNCYVISWK